MSKTQILDIGAFVITAILIVAVVVVRIVTGEIPAELGGGMTLGLGWVFRSAVATK